MPHETGLHTDESKGLTKKGESRKPLHDYVQDLRSLTNVGQCPHNIGHEAKWVILASHSDRADRDFKEYKMQICCYFGSQCRQVLLDSLQSWSNYGTD